MVRKSNHLNQLQKLESRVRQRKHLTNSPKHPKMIKAITSLTLTASAVGNSQWETGNFSAVCY